MRLPQPGRGAYATAESRQFLVRVFVQLVLARENYDRLTWVQGFHFIQMGESRGVVPFAQRIQPDLLKRTLGGCIQAYQLRSKLLARAGPIVSMMRVLHRWQQNGVLMTWITLDAWKYLNY
jgi:hypothetical protein